MCSRNCESSYIGDGICDDSCDVKACNFDDEDCSEESGSSGSKLSSDTMIIIVVSVLSVVLL
jgi:hypothetical protein